MFKTRNAAVMAIIGLILTYSGCATIMHGNRQNIEISSTPTGAIVTIDDKIYGKTPLIAKLRREYTHEVKIEMAGYQPFEALITRSRSGWQWGNVIFGLIIGIAVDTRTGGIYKLTPGQIAATLGKEDTGFLYYNDAIYLSVVLKSDSRWERIATLRPASSK